MCDRCASSVHVITAIRAMWWPLGHTQIFHRRTPLLRITDGIPSLPHCHISGEGSTHHCAHSNQSVSCFTQYAADAAFTTPDGRPTTATYEHVPTSDTLTTLAQQVRQTHYTGRDGTLHTVRATQANSARVMYQSTQSLSREICTCCCTVCHRPLLVSTDAR